MKRGIFICLLVFGLTQVAESNVGAETKDISSKSQPNINFRYFDKNKGGAVKITNADNPSFNHLGAPGGVSTAVSSGGFKPSTIATSNVPPSRHLYNQLYYQPNPYLTYVQLPQAAQIAAQYSIQSNPVAHFLQTPNQIQYVAAPSIAQVPQIKFQTFSNDYTPTNTPTNAPTSDSSSTAANSQYISQSQQSTSPQVYATSASSASSSSSATTQAKQVQVPFYSAPQPVYYTTQQPLVTYLPQAQPANFIYQQPNANFILKQQHQLASLYGANRFGLYTPTQNAQLTYLVPVVVSQPQQDPTTTTSTSKTSDNTVSNGQQSASSSSFTYGTKA